MPRSSNLRLEQFVEDFVDVGTTVLTKGTSLPPAVIRELVFSFAREFCFRNAKSDLYVPEARGLTLRVRNFEIAADFERDSDRPGGPRKFTESRALELAAKHDLSMQMIRTIIKNERDRRRALAPAEAAAEDAADAAA